MSARKVAVLAFGGNALLRAGERGTHREQMERAVEAARRIVETVARGFRVVVIHGNAPQVGNLLIQQEEASTHVPPSPLEVCVAATQGTMGYMLEQSLRNELLARGMRREVITLLTLVEVDPKDPAFDRPSKPVGPVLTTQRARYLRMVEHATVVEEHGRGYRKTVASPVPLSLVEAPMLRRLVDAGVILLAGGGGGVPVVRGRNGGLRGVEAVIDKDRTAAILARAVGATHLVILTEVETVFEGFDGPRPRPIRRASPRRMKDLLRKGEFPPGSMGPKIEAALDFLSHGGREVLITSLEALPRAVAGKTGTHIRPSPRRAGGKRAETRPARRLTRVV